MSNASIFHRLDAIPYAPQITPDAFCGAQPCVELSLGARHFILSQPTSTAIVYVLGLMWLGAGVYFWRTRNGQQSRLWWSVALFLGGAAALSAGTSYQAFGYEIKCAGRAVCTWTSWWEVAYQTLQVASMDAMLMAVACSSTVGRKRTMLKTYAVANALAHLGITAVGALTPVKFLISFELLVLFSTPNLLLVLGISFFRYRKHRQELDRALVIAGLWLVVTTGAYYAYFMLGYTQILWRRGIWFSDNDVLHIGMILWILYIPLVMGKWVKDA